MSFPLHEAESHRCPLNNYLKVGSFTNFLVEGAEKDHLGI